MMGGSRGMLAATHPLVVPMLLRLSHFKLDSYVVLVVSRQKGITLVFKTDPLQNVDINSTFDSIAVIQKFIQREIEGQLRQMFKEDLPGIIHRLSQRWVKAKVEAPYLNKRPPPVRPRTTAVSDTGLPPYGVPPLLIPVGLPPSISRTPSLPPMRGRPSSISGASRSHLGHRPASSVASTPSQRHTTYDPLSDEEEPYDPTFGLRPEGLPSKTVFTSFRTLFGPSKGLADLTEERNELDELDEEETRSYDFGNWEDLLPESSFGAPSELDDTTEYETVPAVGGGTITRPRTIHAHTPLLSPSRPSTRAPSPTNSRAPSIARSSSYRTPQSATSPHHPGLHRAFSALSMSDRPHSWNGQYNPYFAGTTPMYDGSLDGHYYLHHGMADMRYRMTSSPPPAPSVPHLDEPTPRRFGSPSSTRTRNSVSSDMTQSVPTPPNAHMDEEGIQISRSRRSSFSSFNGIERFGSPPDSLSLVDHESKIVLKPGLSSVSRLSTLSQTNHTLSPYVRPLEHFMARSAPPREAASSGSGSAVERHPAKAKRKRTFYLGGKPKSKEQSPAAPAISRPFSPEPPLSEFDASDMDRYFRSRDDLIPQYPDLHPSHLRRRSTRQH